MDRQKFIDGMSSTVEALSHDEMRLKIQSAVRELTRTSLSAWVS